MENNILIMLYLTLIFFSIAVIGMVFFWIFVDSVFGLFINFLIIIFMTATLSFLVLGQKYRDKNE